MRMCRCNYHIYFCFEMSVVGLPITFFEAHDRTSLYFIGNKRQKKEKEAQSPRCLSFPQRPLVQSLPTVHC